MASKVEEEKEWTVELEDRYDCDDLLSNIKKYERASRIKKANQMKYGFLLGQNTNIVDQAGYEEEVTRRQSKERKEKVARRNTDVEMKITELLVRGTKRKAMRKETPRRKGSQGQGSQEEATRQPLVGSSGNNHLVSWK